MLIPLLFSKDLKNDAKLSFKDGHPAHRAQVQQTCSVILYLWLRHAVISLAQALGVILAGSIASDMPEPPWAAVTIWHFITGSQAETSDSVKIKLYCERWSQAMENPITHHSTLLNTIPNSCLYLQWSFQIWLGRICLHSIAVKWSVCHFLPLLLLLKQVLDILCTHLHLYMKRRSGGETLWEAIPISSLKQWPNISQWHCC